jgi:hypothetical protein
MGARTSATKGQKGSENLSESGDAEPEPAGAAKSRELRSGGLCFQAAAGLERYRTQKINTTQRASSRKTMNAATMNDELEEEFSVFSKKSCLS